MTTPTPPQQPQNVVYVQTPRKRRWPWVLGGIVALFIIIGIANSPKSGSTASTVVVPGNTDAPSKPDTGPTSVAGLAPPADTDATQDVRIDDCQVTTNSFATESKVKVTVTNHTSQMQSYWVTVAINDKNGGTRYGEATAITNSLGAGQTAVLDATGFPRKPAGAFACSIAKVDRIPA